MKLLNKRLFSFLLAVVMLLGMMPMTVFAAEETEAACGHSYENGICTGCDAIDPAYFEYTLSADGTITLTKYIGSDAAIVVADSYTVDGAAYNTVLDSSCVFRGNTTITSVTLGAGVKFKDNSMGYLFAECTKLTAVDLSEVNTADVTDMSYLFYKCSALTALELSGLDTGNVTTMRAMFSYCTKLKELSGYENWDTGSLEEMYHMFNRVASGAGSMECIDLSGWDLDQVTNTGWCFQLCYAKQILLPDNLAVISAGFLNHATKVTGTAYTIPAGVKKIGYAHTIYDFATNDFVKFVVAEGNTNYQAVDGILYSADGTQMLAVPRNKPFEDGVYEIPEGVTFLGELSFSRNYNINTLVLPDSYVIEYVPLYDDAYIIFEDKGNLNHGTNLSIAIYCYTGITDYAVKDSNPNYASLNGIIYNRDMTEVVAIPSRYARTIVIPEGVAKWNYQASWTDDLYPDTNGTVDGLMANCPGVYIPASLTDISADQIDKLNRIFISRAGTDNPFTITIAEGNTAFELDEAEGLIVKAHVHSYEASVTAPTCTEQGYTTYTCECGDSYVDDYVEANGHSWTNGKCRACDKQITVSILGASISTYTGISNNPDYNSTIGNNAVYYTEGRYGVYVNDTWWMQVANDLGLHLLVNNSWSGSSLLHERNGTVGAYVDRCVQLHNNEGEVPDIIAIQMGTNDFQYYKDTLGTADIDYAALITENEDGSFTYAEPTTSLEAAVIVLHKIAIRYPDAEVYYLNISQRIDGTDELIHSFNAELKQVVEHFGAHIVDIYGSAITMADFDTYIGDGRVHPNCLGMDAYTEAFKRALLANSAYEVDTNTVSLDLNGVTADYGDDKIVVSGDAFSCELTAENGKELSVSVTMGGEDITDTTYENGTISIESVTDDVVITAEATIHKSQNYCWEFDGTDLVCVSGSNALTKDSGTTTDGVFSQTSYTLETEVVLMHDLPWVVEWKCEGTFQNSGSSSGARVFTSDNVNANYNARFIFKSNTNGIIAMGEKTTSGSHNCGIALGDYGIDWTALHTYRLENRIADDGSNMIWLLVDGEEIGPMNHYYIGTKDQAATSDWVSGEDFVFPYMGTDTHGFTNASIEYIQVSECDHTYENGICTACGAEHPNFANYEGKVISILGDSISTFAGYIPTADGFNLEHDARYPQDNLLTDVNETWWMQVLTELDAKLGINESWRSTEVYNYIDAEVNSSYDGTKACMASLTRIQNLGSNGTPDVILFFGGTNDITQSRPVGTFDPAAAPTEVDLASVKWDSVADAYVDAIMRMQYYYPDAQIIAMLPFDRSSQGADKVEQYNSLFISICEHYGVPCVDLRACGISDADLPDGTHPDATGMDYITAAVMDVLMSDCDVEAGEHIVHSITHNLTGAESSLSYYKGISHGNSFETTITGENLEITVTMDGVDITDSCYDNGVVSVDNVTGNLVITASGVEKTIYADYLQELPENFCSGTNLWVALVPANLYYTGSGWGLNASCSVYSITIPISEGYQLWATSFQKSGTNGGTRNGIRLTWFDENGVLESVSPDNVYAEFSANGCLAAPEGAVAVNIAMWNSNESNKVYILNRDHTYENGICTGCGEAQSGPVITQQPTNGESKLGEHYMVEVKAEGKGLKYQWYFRNAGSSKWNKSSVKDNTYDDVMTTARAGREVYCVITDANGNSVTTDIVKLVLLPSEELEITQQPTDDQVYFGEDFCVTVEAKGDGLKYQWYFCNAGSDKWYKSSVKDNTYDDVMTKARAGREIYCVITDAYGNSVTTETVKLICIPTELEIISQPTSAEVSFGEMFCATVEAKGDGLKYQWYFRNSGTDKWYKSGVRDNTYDDVMTKARNHREIYCVITDMWGNSVTTDTVKLTAVPSVELKVLSQSYESAVMGERYCVTVEAQGDDLNYQWYFRNAGASRWSKSGVRDNTYDDVMNKTRANREVYCVISDACGNQITTEVITLTVEK